MSFIFGRQLSSNATERHVKFQNNWKTLNTDIAGSRLCESLRMLNRSLKSRPISLKKDRLSRYRITMLKIRRSRDLRIFNVRISILVRRHLYIETASRLQDDHNAFLKSWRRCPTYGRDVISYCYLRFCNLCMSPWLTSNGVGLNIYWVAYLALSGHFKGNCVYFWPYTISKYTPP